VATTQLFIGLAPLTASERRALRDQAFELSEQLRQANRPEPTVALLNFGAGASDPVDLLLLRPHAVIVASLMRPAGPIDASAGQPWRERDTGAALLGPAGLAPLDRARLHRDAVAARLRDAGLALAATSRVVGAVVCAPAIPSSSQISLDVDDHRSGLKVLGLDELAGVAAMVQSGVQLYEDQMRAVAVDLFGGRLWLDGGRSVLELAEPRFGLRTLAGERAGDLVSLHEGETVLGRRRVPRSHERRFVISGDDLVSNDHAVLEYGDEDAIVLRDTSKNGTWLASPGEPELHVRGAACRVAHGTVLRLGMTRLRVERLSP
jgi:hypothetical protein